MRKCVCARARDFLRIYDEFYVNDELRLLCLILKILKQFFLDYRMLLKVKKNNFDSNDVVDA